MPLVSVQIASYNLRSLIGDAIDSVLNQTYQDFELVVIDDGSTDDSVAFIKERYCDQLTLLQHENHGIAYTQNVGIRRAQGRYVAFLDADDVWQATYLEKMIALIESCSENVGMVYSACVVEGKYNQPNWIHRPAYRGNCLYYHLTCKLMISPSRVVVKRKVFDRVGLFDTSFKRSLDTDMWTRIARYYDADYIEEPLVRKRFIGTNVMCDASLFLEGVRILDKVFADSSCPPEVRSWKRRAYASRYLEGLSSYSKIHHVRGTLQSFVGVLKWRPVSIRLRHLKQVARVLLKWLRK